MFNLKHALKAKNFFSFLHKVRFYNFSEHGVNFPDKVDSTEPLNSPPPIQNKTQELDYSLASSKINRLLQVLDSNTNKTSFLYQRIAMEFSELFKLNELIIHNKENAQDLIKALVKLKIEAEKLHLTRTGSDKGGGDSFQIVQETPDSYLLFSKTWEKVLVRANFYQKDPDLLFETLYQIPAVFHDSVDMTAFTEGFLTNQKANLPVSATLFFLSKTLIQTRKSEIIPRSLINLALSKFDEVRKSLFDLGMLNFIYYQAVSRYYVSVQKLNKWNIAQHVSVELEEKFQKLEFINVSPVTKLRKGERKLFYEHIIQETLDYLDRFEKGEIQISEKELIQSLLFLFKSIARFSVQSKALFETMDKFTIKYIHHLDLTDKFTLLMSYAKYYNVVPGFAPLFEKDMENSLKELVFNLKFKPKIVLSKSMKENVYSEEQFYLHVKKGFNPDFDGKDLPVIFTQNNSILSIKQVISMYWYLGKTNTGHQSPELIKHANSILNLFLNLYPKFQIADIFQSACALSEMTPPGFVDWEKDLKFKLEVLTSKCKDWDPTKGQQLAPFSVASLYKNMYYMKLKFGIDAFAYFTQPQLTYLKMEWMNSIKRHRKSKMEELIQNAITRYFKKNNIQKSISTNKHLEVFLVDLFIAPDLIVEINGNFHFPRDSSLQILRKAFYGNFFIRSSIFSNLGYKLLTLNYFDFEDFMENEEKLEAFVAEKLKPYI